MMEEAGDTHAAAGAPAGEASSAGADGPAPGARRAEASGEATARLGDAAVLEAANLGARVAQLRVQVARLRASRRVLMGLLEMEARRRAAVERRLERLVTVVRAYRRERRRTLARPGGG